MGEAPLARVGGQTDGGQLSLTSKDKKNPRAGIDQGQFFVTALRQAHSCEHRQTDTHTLPAGEAASSALGTWACLRKVAQRTLGGTSHHTCGHATGPLLPLVGS